MGTTNDDVDTVGLAPQLGRPGWNGTAAAAPTCTHACTSSVSAANGGGGCPPSGHHSDLRSAVVPSVEFTASTALRGS